MTEIAHYRHPAQSTRWETDFYVFAKVEFPSSQGKPMFEEVVWGSDFARTGWRKVNAEGVSPVGFARREDADKDVMSDRARWFNGQELTAVHDLRFLKRTVVTATYYEDVP